MGRRYVDHRCVARALRRGDRDGANRLRRLRRARSGGDRREVRVPRQTRHEHRGGELHVRTELVDGLAHASGPNARDRKVGQLHRVPRRGLRSDRLRTRGRVRGAPDDRSRWAKRDHRRTSSSESCSSRCRSVAALGSTSRSPRTATSRRQHQRPHVGTTADTQRGRSSDRPLCPPTSRSRLSKAARDAVVAESNPYRLIVVHRDRRSARSACARAR